MDIFDQMGISGCLGLVMIGTFLFIAVCSFVEYSRKKMSDSLSMMWTVFSVVLLLLGVLLMLGGKREAFIYMVIMIIGLLLLFMLFFLSRMVSELMMKVRELAMQVALLNQENDAMLRELGKMGEQEKNE